MKEIELLVRVDETKESALHKLKPLEFLGRKKIHDVYFWDPKTGRFGAKKSGKNPKGPSEALRVRQQNGKVLVTYKDDHFDPAGKWLYSDEEEAEVSDFENIIKILKHIGYEELGRLENERQVYKSGEYEIVFEDVKNLGLFMEVEILTEEEVDVPAIKREMAEFLKKLGLHVSEELNQGKFELLMKKTSN